MINSNNSSSLIISYLTMRRIIGILGIGLPIIIVLGGFIQKGFILYESISSYYYTNMHDFFVGILSCVGLFLISYKGYERIDSITSTISGILAVGTALFPTSSDFGGINKVGIFQLDNNVSYYFHITFALFFFLSMAFISIFLFTRYESTTITKEKKKRNLVYIVCGCVILFSILFIIVYSVVLQNTALTKFKPKLIFETLLLISFGISWLVKGETVFKDKKYGQL
jgi:nicotinamide riboside transporter PnuC